MGGRPAGSLPGWDERMVREAMRKLQIRKARPTVQAIKTMQAIKYVLKFAIASLVAFLAVPCAAQGIAPLTRYPTPALSPWFNLYNRQGGPVDNYNMFVQPEVQLRNTLQRQQFYNQRQTAASTTLGQQVSQLEEDRLGVQPTGAPSGFMNAGRYFGVTSVGGQGSFNTSIGRGTAHTSPAGRNNWTAPASNPRPGG